ncbi:chemotaxis protein CheD [Candidatus Viadribacter manganicus]|uniref:Probable chemoreceptor glutamine deamidase CheD n=1 Tax=Candidatus Viadribacter manganicus TaxID=1759059 RepID=A0A1B1AGI6_9PROT|nr:hypothetical protein [Candidatus Viadribacter manganicus]ANP45673.1 hypothetical protein ATE48_06930 [Candidatus Viadribacter manganicus]
MTSAASSTSRQRVIHVVQGEYMIVRDPQVMLTTILGSCVATCLWDPIAEVGGMNHFLLPGEEEGVGEEMKYGVNAMELLINGLLQQGAQRTRLQAKLFGGAHVVHNLSDVGQKNAEFALRFLSMERIACTAQSLGGAQARRVRFWPTSGRAGQMLLASTHVEAFSAERRRSPAPVNDAAGSVELF